MACAHTHRRSAKVVAPKVFAGARNGELASLFPKADQICIECHESVKLCRLPVLTERAHSRSTQSRACRVCVFVCALALAHYIMRHEFIKRDFAFMFLRKMHRENDINTLLGIYMRARARALRPGCCARARARC